MKKKVTIYIALTFSFIVQSQQQNINDLIKNLENPRNKEIIVVAHRGDWRHAPRKFTTSHSKLHPNGSRHGRN